MGAEMERITRMKLLIITQAVDEQDPILGFFCNWLTAFSKKCEQIEVICLKEGVHHLPHNVWVHSLGKEKRSVRIMYIARLGWYIWRLRKNYDHVLVHMNPEYVILACLDWWLMGKKVALWYNHPQNDLKLRLAARLADKVFYTSPYAATAQMPHAIRMPAGIDTEMFKPQTVPRDRNALYMQGRITPSKHVDAALRAFEAFREFVPEATLTLVGPEDKEYGKKLREEFSHLLDAVRFLGSKQNTETPALYSAHGISINLAADGHYDKSVLESMACGTPTVFSSKAFTGFISGQVYAPTPESLTAALLHIKELSESNYRQLSIAVRNVVVEKESLDFLAIKLFSELQ
jgi:glycosyltransferase involved in cell wall biosynthesis